MRNPSWQLRSLVHGAVGAQSKRLTLEPFLVKHEQRSDAAVFVQVLMLGPAVKSRIPGPLTDPDQDQLLLKSLFKLRGCVSAVLEGDPEQLEAVMECRALGLYELAKRETWRLSD